MASTNYSASELATNLGSEPGTSDAIEAQQLVGAGAAESPLRYKMRGTDSDAGYVTWVVVGAADPDGGQATGANTTPALVGAVVAGSGIVLSKW